MNISEAITTTVDLHTGEIRICSTISSAYFPLGKEYHDLRLFILRELNGKIVEHIHWLNGPDTLDGEQ